MRTTWFSILVLLVASSLVAVAQQALQPPQKWVFRLNVQVDGNPQTVTLVKSYVNREMRALGDVVITQDDPGYQMEILVAQEAQVYALSVVTWNQLDKKTFLPTLLKAYHVDPSQADPLFSILVPARLDTKHYLQACPILRLEEAVKRIVAQYDVDTLQKDRDIWQKASDAKNKGTPK